MRTDAINRFASSELCRSLQDGGKTPLTPYRQAQVLLSQGITIERATLAFWVGYAVAELKPLYLRLRELCFAGPNLAGQYAARRSAGTLLLPNPKA